MPYYRRRGSYGRYSGYGGRYRKKTYGRTYKRRRATAKGRRPSRKGYRRALYRRYRKRARASGKYANSPPLYLHKVGGSTFTFGQVELEAGQNKRFFIPNEQSPGPTRNDMEDMRNKMVSDMMIDGPETTVAVGNRDITFKGSKRYGEYRVTNYGNTKLTVKLWELRPRDDYDQGDIFSEGNIPELMTNNVYGQSMAVQSGGLYIPNGNIYGFSPYDFPSLTSMFKVKQIRKFRLGISNTKTFRYKYPGWTYSDLMDKRNLGVNGLSMWRRSIIYMWEVIADPCIAALVDPVPPGIPEYVPLPGDQWKIGITSYHWHKFYLKYSGFSKGILESNKLYPEGYLFQTAKHVVNANPTETEFEDVY